MANSPYTTADGNTVKYDNGANGWTMYSPTGQSLASGVANAPAPATQASSGNSIGTGLTPTSSGSKSVASSGLGGGVTTLPGNPNQTPQVNTLPGTTQPNQLTPLSNTTQGLSSLMNTPATKSNLYYAPGDTQAAQQLSAYYNLVPYTQGDVLGANDKAIGGNAVIPDSALPNASARIAAGFDAAGTAQQVAAYAKAMTQISPEAYMKMPQNQLAQMVQQNGQVVQSVFGKMQDLVSQAVQPENINLAPVLGGYMDKLDGYFGQMLQQAQDAYKNGMNDPGLVQAVAMIKDQSTTLKQQLDEQLNARNMGQSGIWINAMNAQDKSAEQASATVISTHLSELTKALQDSMTNVLNQRAAVLSQFAGYESQAAIENTKNHIQQMQIAIQGLGSLAQTMQAGVNNLNDNATSIINTNTQANQSNLNNQRDNTQSNLNNQRDNAQREVESQRTYDLGIQQLGLDQAKLAETSREFDASNMVDWAKINEDIRHNKAAEATASVQAAAAMTSAGAAAKKASQGNMSDAINLSNFQANHAIAVGGSIDSLQKKIKDGVISASDVLNNQDKYKTMIGAGTSSLADNSRENGLWNNFISGYVQPSVDASNAATTQDTSTPWWQQIFTPSQSVSDAISTMWGN